MYFIIFKVYKSDFDGINFVYFKYLTSTLFKICICDIAILFNFLSLSLWLNPSFIKTEFKFSKLIII